MTTATESRRQAPSVGQPQPSVVAFIIERARRAGWSQRELADRMHISPSALSRLLTGKSRWSRLTPTAIADALNLSGAERTTLFALYESTQSQSEQGRGQAEADMARSLDTADARASDAQRLAVGPGRRSRVGRKPGATVSAIGLLIEPLMLESDMTRSELADALGVKASTVTRLMSGAQSSTHVISAHRMADAPRLGGVSRRAFLGQAAALGAFALVSGQPALPALRYRAIDLERVDEELRDAQRLLDAGEAARTLKRAEALHEALLASPFPRTHRAAALRRVEAALLLGRAQEAALPWGDTRAANTIQTYNHIASEILNWFPIGELAVYYARLNERRAPLYRELEQYGESIRQFTHAIDDCMPYVDDLALLVALYRNRAHVWAMQGREREWRRDLDRAARVAMRATGDQRSGLEGLILYSEAEGFKRLASVAEQPARQRAYAGAALISFAQARAKTARERASHHVLLDVSEAQTYLWLDPSESERLASAARERALDSYPSLHSKIELTLAQAQAAQRQRR